MGSLILCHDVKAKQPYEIIRIHMKIYTIEELCYYIGNHLYLIDYTLVNRRLCDWLKDELDLKALSDQLRDALNQNCTIDHFVMLLLKGSGIYPTSYLYQIQKTLEKLESQKEVERTKFKADNLMKTGEFDAAIRVYQQIIHSDPDETVPKEFYGNVYACLGSAYGRLLLYEEAARMYLEAYKIIKNEAVMKAYLYSCMKAIPEDQYVKMLSGNSAFLSMDAQLKEEIRNAIEKAEEAVSGQSVADWRNGYRTINKIS